MNVRSWIAVVVGWTVSLVAFPSGAAPAKPKTLSSFELFSLQKALQERFRFKVGKPKLQLGQPLLAQTLKSDPSASGEMIDNEKNVDRKPPPRVRKVVVAPKPKFRRYGIELRGGMLFFPEFMLNATFFDESVGVIQGGFGLGFVLKTDPTFEYIFGVSYNFFQFQPGTDSEGRPLPNVFLNKGDPTFQREFIQSDLSYLAIDVRFQKIFPIHKHFQMMVGAGIGLGVVLGELRRTDTFIPDYDASKEEEYKQAYKLWRANPQDSSALPNKVCTQVDRTVQDCTLIEAKEDRVPPVIPLFDFIIGMVFPIVPDRFDIRVQGGFGFPRLFWVSMSTHIMF